MILFYFPGACSLADRIALIEAQLPFGSIRIDKEKRTEDGRDYLSINPKGHVPALELDDGSILTENPVILAYIAERSGRLLPKGEARWPVLEACHFLASDVHANLRPFFVGSPAPVKDAARNKLTLYFALLAGQMGGRPYLFEDGMTIADPYLFWATRWAGIHGIELPQPLQSHRERMVREPSVARALAEEGLA